MDQERRLHRQCLYLCDRLAERRGRVRVRRLVKSEMRIADLHEGEFAFRGFGGTGVAYQPNGARYAAAYRPDNAGPRPRHAFQEAATIDAQGCGCFAFGMRAHGVFPVETVDSKVTGDAPGLFTATRKKNCRSTALLGDLLAANGARSPLRHHRSGVSHNRVTFTSGCRGNARVGRKSPRQQRGRLARPRQHPECRSGMGGNGHTRCFLETVSAQRFPEPALRRTTLRSATSRGYDR